MSKGTALMFCLDSLAILVSVIYFSYISKDWKYLFGASVTVSLLNIINVAKIPESPKFYFSQHDFSKTKQILTLIGRSNGILSPG